ncbi:hypothetical protein [Phytoactinopolyspora halophila]|uniref:hypothetical protein n=1 Tax=Phytoactinopolyspora halophila TaxID=1981511 RepID=UPI000F4DBB60|nr:hypothetical protein [Phytoactinopolyspora halophila]
MQDQLGGGELATNNPLLEQWTTGVSQGTAPGGPGGRFQEMREYWQRRRQEIQQMLEQSGASGLFPGPMRNLVEHGQAGPPQDQSLRPGPMADLMGQSTQHEGPPLRPEVEPSTTGTPPELDAARSEFADEQKRLRDLTQRILGLDRDPTPSEVAEVWNLGVDQMEAADAVGADPIDPWHWIEQEAANAELEREEAEKAELEVSRDIQKVISLTDPDTAGTVIRSAMQRILRRDPSEEEVQAFVEALNEKERGSPQVTERTVTPGEDGEATVTETTQEGGAPQPGEFAEMFINDEFRDEADIQYIGTDLYQGIIQALGSPV